LNGDLSADRYVTPDTGGFDVANVVGLRLSLLLQTLMGNVTLSNQTYTFDGNTTTATDGRLRRVFTTTVNLRNRTTN
jgi:type IV pilus assembly protein PilW